MTNNDIDQQAISFGNDKAKLKKRLNSAKFMLTDHYQQYFKKSKFDFEKKQLIGNGAYALQWAVRMYPKAPVSYTNQQTSDGVVFLTNAPSESAKKLMNELEAKFGWVHSELGTNEGTQRKILNIGVQNLTEERYHVLMDDIIYP